MKMKILVVSSGMQIGGVERSLIGFLDALDRADTSVDLFLFEHCGELMKYLPTHVHLLAENKLLALSKRQIISLIKNGHIFVGTIRLLAKLYSFIAAKITKLPNINLLRCDKWLMPFIKKQCGRYDVAFGFSIPHLFMIKKITADVKYGWVHTDYSAPDVGVNKKFERPIWMTLDKIVCVSKSCREAFVGIFPDLESKVTVIENILVSQFIREQSEEYSNVDEMPDGEHTKILSIGRFCTAKAFDEAVPACKKIIEDGYPIKWYIIGYGSGEEIIREQIDKYKMQNDFIILGKKVNPYPYIKCSDIYVQPSRYEGKSVAVIEAQILGKPVLITDFATARDQVEDGVDGYICPMGIDGVVQGIEYLLENPEFMLMIAKNAAQKVYGSSGNIDKLLTIVNGEEYGKQ